MLSDSSCASRCTRRSRSRGCPRALVACTGCTCEKLASSLSRRIWRNKFGKPAAWKEVPTRKGFSPHRAQKDSPPQPPKTPHSPKPTHVISELRTHFAPGIFVRLDAVTGHRQPCIKPPSKLAQSALIGEDLVKLTAGLLSRVGHAEMFDHHPRRPPCRRQGRRCQATCCASQSRSETCQASDGQQTACPDPVCRRTSG